MLGKATGSSSGDGRGKGRCDCERQNACLVAGVLGQVAADWGQVAVSWGRWQALWGRCQSRRCLGPESNCCHSVFYTEMRGYFCHNGMDDHDTRGSLHVLGRTRAAGVAKHVEQDARGTQHACAQ